MTTADLRNILIKIVGSQERLVTENVALKAVLQFAEPRPGEPPLQTQLAELIEDAANGPVHQQFEVLRQQIQQAAGDQQLNDLLMQFPPQGEPN